MERTQDTGTNFTQYVEQEGFNPNKPETIPTTIFSPTKLDTAQKMEKAGLSPRIIDMRLNPTTASGLISLAIPEVATAQSIAKKITTVSTPKFQRSMASRIDVFHAKRTGTPVIISPTQSSTIKLASSPTSRSFVPQIQHQASEPIGQVAVGKATSVTTMGFGSTPTNLISKIGLTELIVAEAILIGGIAILTKEVVEMRTITNRDMQNPDEPNLPFAQSLTNRDMQNPDEPNLPFAQRPSKFVYRVIIL